MVKFTRLVLSATATMMALTETAGDKSGKAKASKADGYSFAEGGFSSKAGKANGSSGKGSGQGGTDPSYGHSDSDNSGGAHGNSDVSDADTFEPAISLAKFSALDRSNKLGDGSYFEWVKKEEIEAGGTTCGFLHAPLRWPNAEDDMSFPEVKVYVCVKFAEIQPAPRGNLAVHCGGPNSLSDCVYLMGGEDLIGEIAAKTYNVISFDQRGMGRSQPSFYTQECAAVDGDVNVLDEESIRKMARAYKERNLKCWNYEGFHLEKVQSNGDVEAFHFLEYSGTRQLAEDIERVRLLFGDQKLSVYGISYGTAVMGTYVTTFPINVNHMVLDSCQYPVTDLIPNALDDAKGNNQRIEFFVASCEMNGGGHCGVSDLGTCLKNMYQLTEKNTDEINAMGDGVPLSSLDLFSGLTLIFMADLEKIPDFCEAVASKDSETFLSLIQQAVQDDADSPDAVEVRNVNRQAGMQCLVMPPDDKPYYGCDSKPSTQGYDDFFFPGYVSDLADGINLQLVRSQDYAFGIYSEDQYVDLVMEISRKYPGAGTQLPATRLVSDLGGGYYIPNTTPLVPMGTPLQRGIIGGQLYDRATPYVGSQLMRQNFPLASLLTSRSVNHGLNDARANGATDPVCQGHVQRYFKTGVVDIVDGHVCESDPITDSCTISDALTDGRCSGRKRRRRMKVEDDGN